MFRHRAGDNAERTKRSCARAHKESEGSAAIAQEANVHRRSRDRRVKIIGATNGSRAMAAPVEVGRAECDE